MHRTAGHRTVPHTADLRIEAWAGSREECLAEAVRGLVGSFAVVAGRQPYRRDGRAMTARSDEDLLVALLDEVIYRLDVDGEIPVSVAVRPLPGRRRDRNLRTGAGGRGGDHRRGAEGGIAARTAVRAGRGGPVVLRGDSRRLGATFDLGRRTSPARGKPAPIRAMTHRAV